jgi:hypothetical protein
MVRHTSGKHLLMNAFLNDILVKVVVDTAAMITLVKFRTKRWPLGLILSCLNPHFLSLNRWMCLFFGMEHSCHHDFESYVPGMVRENEIQSVWIGPVPCN